MFLGQCVTGDRLVPRQQYQAIVFSCVQLGSAEPVA